MNLGKTNISFCIKTYILSVIINIPVMTWQVLHPLTPANHNQPDFLPALIISVWTSALLFIPVAILFFLLASLTASLQREKTYFIILSGSIVIPLVTWFMARNIYSEHANAFTIASIAAFSSLVSVAFYYTFFMGEEIEEAPPKIK